MTTAPGPALSPSSSSLLPRVGRLVAYAFLLLYLLGSVRAILERSNWQSDALLRHHAITAWHAGLNPYDPADISRVSGTKFDTAYIYPPDTLPFYKVFSWFGLDGVRPFYLGFQLLLLAALVACWQRFFLDAEDRFHPWFFVLCLAGLSNTLFTELQVGNISLLEQTLLWWGLAAWLRGRYTLFVTLLWLAAACKLTLLAFSVLLLLPPARRWGLFALAWLAMAVRLGLDRLLSPTLFHHFTQALVGGFGGANDGGRNNPCLLEVLKDLCWKYVYETIEPGDINAVVLPAYAVLVLIVLGVSWLAWRAICRRYPAGTGGNALHAPRGVRLIFLVCLAYTLTVPRMKDYSYILLLPVVWQVGKWCLARHPQAWLAFVALFCLGNFSESVPLMEIYDLLWRYLPYVAAVAAWVLLLREAFAPVATAAVLADSPPLQELDR